MPELLEVSMIASVAGEIRDGALTARRPFRSRHHFASMTNFVRARQAVPVTNFLRSMSIRPSFPLGRSAVN
jgi:predicted ATPase with chaperone activity